MGASGAEADNELAVLLRPVWSAEKTRETLQVRSTQSLVQRQVNGTLLGLTTTDGETVYPVWQFHRVGGEVEVWPALAAMLQVLREHDPWSVALLMRRVRGEELEGFTPLEWVQAGRDPEALVDLATAVAREWR